MNKDIEEAAIKLNQWILNQETVKEYQYYESLIKQNKDLKEREIELKNLQKLIVQKKSQDENCEDIIRTYNEKKQYFDEHPLVHNYLELKNEVNDLLIEIKTQIEQGLIENM